MPSNRLNNTKCYCLTLFCSIHVSQPFYMPLSFSIYLHNELFRLKAFFSVSQAQFFLQINYGPFLPGCCPQTTEYLVVNLSVRNNGCKSHHAQTGNGFQNSMEKSEGRFYTTVRHVVVVYMVLLCKKIVYVNE